MADNNGVTSAGVVSQVQPALAKSPVLAQVSAKGRIAAKVEVTPAIPLPVALSSARTTPALVLVRRGESDPVSRLGAVGHLAHPA